jgi:hypothetical protein
MNPNRLYEKYLIKVEKNSTNDNFSTDRGKFAELYNEISVRFIKLFLNNRNFDNLKDIQVLLINDLPLTPDISQEDFKSFQLPPNFLSWSFAKAKASKGECTEQDIGLYEIRDEDRADFTNNTFFKPSFAFREAPYNYTENNIKVYTEEGMTITELLLTYYKYPKKIILQDTENPESQFEDTEIELPEHIVDRIISGMVGDFKINTSDPTYEIEKFRQNENVQ